MAFLAVASIARRRFDAPVLCSHPGCWRNLRANVGARALASDRPQVMGILNVTPDSFSDGGRYVSCSRAVAHARAMVDAGADWIDIGGESTRPGAPAVTVEMECERVVPVVEALAATVDVPISIDTSKPEVMRAVVAAGAGMINDVRALREPGALEAACELGVPICLMHMRGVPRTMQQTPTYADVVAEVRAFLAERIALCERAGIARDRLVVDPGFGFGKGVEHNYALMRHLAEFAELGLPVLVGVSRKSMIGAVTGQPAERRLHGSVALAVIAAMQGASILRVHDVAATAEALAMVRAVQLGPVPMGS